PSTLPAWTKAANRLLRPGGTLFLIFRADGLALVLAALASNFGAIAIRPVHARAAAPAIRILVRARKARRAPLSLCPPLLLAGDDGRATRAADAVLRDGEALAWPE
ncbi:MAG: methyltransferase, partial [Proteobacteria bacterium]|nr:methyltransferase [Pseudomonadota bacterium]